MAPRKFSGPIQQGAIRVLRDMEVASTSDIMPITHPRQHNPQQRSKSLRLVLDEIAERVGRDGGQGVSLIRPFLLLHLVRSCCCTCSQRLMALRGPRKMSDLSPQSGPERTSTNKVASPI